MATNSQEPQQLQTDKPNLVIQYAKSTQNVCLYLAISALLIIIFILSPLNQHIISYVFGKAIVLCLLAYMMFYNIQQTNQFANNFNISFLELNWTPIKSNIACSYIFTLCLFLLFIQILL
jgi:hypothetical protein